MREMGEDPVIEPQQDAGDGHDDGAPDQRPVLGLLGVVEAPIARELVAAAEVVFDGLDGLFGIAKIGHHVFEPAAPALLQSQVNHVVHRGADEDDSGDAVDPSPNGQMVLPADDGCDPEGMGVLEREAGDHEHGEADQQQDMLPALAEREAELTGLLAIAGEHRARLAPQIDQVMQQHEADRHRNDDEVEDLDEVEDAAAGSGFGKRVDRTDGEAAAGVRVALAAGLAQVRVVHRGARVAGGINIVDAVAAGAVGNGLTAFVRGESVVAVLIGGDAILRHGEAGH